MAVPYYPGALYTPKLGLGLFGQDEILAENFVILDSAFGGGSSINVNGSLVTSPNLNNTLPTAPAGETNVIWQVDINGNVSAYATASSNAAGLDTQVQYNNAGAFGASSNFTFANNGPQTLWSTVAGAGNGGTLTIGRSSGGSENVLEIHTGFALGVAIYSHSSTGFRAPETAYYKSRGTQLAPTAVLNADILAYPNQVFAYDGAGYQPGNTIESRATENWNTTSHGCAWDFFVVRNTTTNQFRAMSIDNTGNVAIGYNSIDNPAVLTVGASGGFRVDILGNITSGVSGTNTGSIAIASATASGKFTITAPASASTPTLTLPTTSNVLAGQFAGDGVVFNSALNTASAAGTLTPTLLTQIANVVLAGPTSAGPSAPTFRALVAADIPSLSYLPLAGGTLSGNLTLSSTLTDGSSSVGTNGQVLSSTATGVKWISVGGTGTVTNTLGSLTQYAVVIGNGGNDETVIGSLGTSGQVLTSGGAGVAPSWSSAPAGLWSGLTNASADLTLANAGFKTTFNQTSAVAWLWANTTTATSGTTNASPLLELAANYWTGAASAQDLWTIGSSLAAGTNGASTITFTHSGSSGNAQVLFPAGTSTAPGVALRQSTQGISANTTSQISIICGAAGGFVFVGNTTNQTLGFICSNSPTIQVQQAGGNLTLQSAVGAQNSAGVLINTSSVNGFLNTSGSQACVQSGSPFQPTSGTGNFFGILDSHVINQTGGANGTIRCLAAYPQNTAVVGTEYLLALGTTTAAGVGGTLTDKFLIDSTGSVKNYNGVATVRNGMAAEYASSDLTAQSAAITATTLLSAPQTGMYKVSWSATITTASDISSVLGGTNGFQVIYTSPTDSVAKTTVPGNSVTSSANTTGTAVGGVEVIYAKTGTNVQFSYGYTDSHTSTAMAYELHVTLESL